MDEMLKDARFAHIAKDPKFRRIPRAERKVKIDKRFQGMFKDKKFKIKYTIDKRGRPMNQTSTENLRKYYELSSSEEESDEEIETPATEKAKKKLKKGESKAKDNKLRKEEDCETNESKEATDNEDEDSSFEELNSSRGELLRIKPNAESEEENEQKKNEENQEEQNSEQDLKENEGQLQIRRKNESSKLPNNVKQKLKDLTVNYARGEGVLFSDSSSDEESLEESEEGEEEDIEHDWGEMDREADTTDEITRRLAVCNMDWDRMRALDLMVLFNSFLPTGGLILSVTIYPSEFGLQRMKEEEVSGPIELTQMKNEEEEQVSHEEENEEGSQYHMEKLRQYQLNRLKYYYAVIEFDSPGTANKVYTDCDGIEYESTATKLDLRFIPDDMEFDQELKERCTELPELAKYQPRQFTTTALQQVKVELTWDETNPERQEIAQKLNSGKIDEVTESDLQAYLAHESSEEEAEAEKIENKLGGGSDSEAESNVDPIAKYKSLLKEIEEQEEAKQNKEVELEFTWGLGEKEKSEKLVKERLKKNESLTPFEEYLEKRKAKRKAKRNERKKLKDANDSDDANSSDADTDDTGDIGGKSSRSGKKKRTADSDSSTDDEEQRRGELELLLMDENNDSKQHFNMKKIEEHATMSKSKQKRLSKKKGAEGEPMKDEFEVNVRDPRFAALFSSHHYNIDPADPHYRKTRGTEALVHEKLKRRADDNADDEMQAKQPNTAKKMDMELQALVKSVKKNTRNIARPIKP